MARIEAYLSAGDCVSEYDMVKIGEFAWNSCLTSVLTGVRAIARMKSLLCEHFYTFNPHRPSLIRPPRRRTITTLPWDQMGATRCEPERP